MNTNQIATRLKKLLQAGQFETAASNLPPTKGILAILEKKQNFRNSVEQFHSLTVSEPVTSFNHIAIALKVEFTFKGQDKTVMDEIIIYQIEDGKIVQEQFFY